MKKEIVISVVAAIAILLVAFEVNAFVLFALVLFVPICLYRKHKDMDKDQNKNEEQDSQLLPLEEATAQYGEPDDCIVADAIRANEAAGCILVYKQKRLLVIAGEPVSMDDIVDVTTVNMATPYTTGQYQLVLTTKKPGREYIRMEVGLDAAWAKDVATEVFDAIKG
jgi:hypothetical protein